MATPDYVLVSEHRYKSGSAEAAILPEGTFVRPIDLKYVPKHVVEADLWRYFNSDKEVFCYTRLGIIAIPKELLRLK